MEAKLNKKMLVIFMQALKIAIGSSAAIYIAKRFDLQFATSAGIIALLTILTTKLETLWLSFLRMVMFVVTTFLSWLLFENIESEWLSYGLFLLIMVILCEWLGWKATISVNAVIGTHFLATNDFSKAFIGNELLLLVIGVSLAIVLNVFWGTDTLKGKIKHNMQYAEEKLRIIQVELASYLLHRETERDVWADIRNLEEHIQHFIEQSYEYQGNTIRKHSYYYVEYFEMRLKQCGALHNLHSEMRKIRKMPIQAKLVADYISELPPYIHEMNDPAPQIEKLEALSAQMAEEELPKTHEEFEARAMLYHVIMDLEEFLIYKRRFIEMWSGERERA